MHAERTTLAPMLLGGMNYFGDPLSVKGGWDSENEIGNTWRRYMAWLAENPARPYALGKGEMYEVHIYGPETERKGYFEVFVGEEVSPHPLPVELSAKWIPGGEYLKITLSGEEISGDWWKDLDSVILPAHGLTRRGTYLIEAYDSRFKGMDRMSESELDIYLPVQARP